MYIGDWDWTSSADSVPVSKLCHMYVHIYIYIYVYVGICM